MCVINPDTRIGATHRLDLWQKCKPSTMAPNSSTGSNAEHRYYYQPPYWSLQAGPYGGPYTPLADCKKEKMDNVYWWQTPGGVQAPTHRNEDNLAQLAGVNIKLSPKPQRHEASFIKPKETYSNLSFDSSSDGCLTGINCGIRGHYGIDSRFEPPPPLMYPHGDAIYAHGGHAGGPTFGSFTPTEF